MLLRTGYIKPELPRRGSIEDNVEIIFLISQQNIICDLSLELSRRDGSNDGSRNMLLWRNMADYP